MHKSLRLSSSWLLLHKEPLQNVVAECNDTYLLANLHLVQGSAGMFHLGTIHQGLLRVEMETPMGPLALGWWLVWAGTSDEAAFGTPMCGLSTQPFGFLTI